MAQNTSISETQHSQQQQPQGSAIPKPTTDASAADAPTDKKDDKAAPVRKRLSLACTTCRQRKVKCDGGRPSCRTCAKFNWPCIYQPSNRKRGPRPRALALMDGSTPYSTRPHWPTAHSYYAYGMAGHPPMSPPLMPPPPPPLHQMIAPMPNQRYMEMPQNGIPMRVNPAHDHMGGYNYDSYSTYSDFVASTGGIRIRPAAPPPHHPHMSLPPPLPSMHSLPFNPMSPPPGHVLGGGGPTRHRAGSRYQVAAPPPHQPHVYHDHRMSFSGLQDGPPYAQLHRSMAPEYDGAGAVFNAPPMAPMHNPPGLMHMPAAPLAGPEIAANAPARQSAIKSPQGSTAPQHMHASAQSHARGMQLTCHDAPTHTSAIYARPAGDADSSRSSSSVCGNLGTTNSAGRFSQLTPPALHPADARVLSSPVQKTAGYVPAAELPRTAPIPSSSAFAAQACHPTDCRGGAHPTNQQFQHLHAGNASEYSDSHDPHLYTLPATDTTEPSHPSSHPLPFSDGLSRPRLPPLSEVLGKDYQLILPSSVDGGDPVVVKDSALPVPSSLTPPRRKDTFASEVSHMRSHENIR